ncbi:hypothetical protein ACWJJH_03490 [Endozoicomonadaceae bacterium StTr2]
MESLVYWSPRDIQQNKEQSMQKRHIVILSLLVFMFSGCAIYDPDRGLFVSSEVQTVELQLPETVPAIYLPGFIYPATTLTDSQETTIASSGAYIPVSHTYRFDETDQMNLYLSVFESFEKSRVELSRESDSLNSLRVYFSEAGMVDDGINGSALLLRANIEIRKGFRIYTREVDIKSRSKLTVAGSKNDAIRQFVNQVSLFVSDVYSQQG